MLMDNSAILALLALGSAAAISALMVSLDNSDRILKIANRVFTAVIIGILLVFIVGCTYPAAQQPRALGLGNVQPMCVILCFQTNNQTDAEQSARQSVNSTTTQSADVGVTSK